MIGETPRSLVTGVLCLLRHYLLFHYLLLTESPLASQQVVVSVVGRGIGCGFTTIYLLPSTYGFPVFSRTTGSVARGDIAGVGLLTVGGFISGRIYFRAFKICFGASSPWGLAFGRSLSRCSHCSRCSFWLLTPSVRGVKIRSS